VVNLMRGNVHLVAKEQAPVPTDIGISIAPTTTFEQCPADHDVLLSGRPRRNGCGDG
jgi:hypothetical protein